MILASPIATVTTLFRNLVEMFETSCSVHATRPALGTKYDTGWKWTTYRELHDLVDRFRGGLASLGVSPGDRVGIVSRNRVEWVVAAHATYGLTATFVPLYEEQKPSEWEFILRDSGVKVAIFGSQALADKLKWERPAPSALEHVVVMGGSGGNSFESLLERGNRSPVPARQPTDDTPATLIYTSGTTGTPKGVMLTHANIMSNVNSVHELFDFTEEDRSLSFIPWAHAFGHTCELHTMLSLGAAIAINDALAHLPLNLVDVEPTVLVAVPKIFNRIFAGIHTELAKEPALVRRLFDAGVRAALLADREKSAGDRLVHWAADRLIFSKIRKRFGGRLKYAVSGGAALAREVAELVQALGITVYEGYGLTETSPIVAANRPGHARLGSVGQVIPGVRVAIQPEAGSTDNDGEIVVYGPNVMKGYHNRPEEQSKVFTPDGGLRTGDTGYLDEEGFLHITGRIKEQYKLENGKYVAPVQLEEELKLSPYVANVMVHGANRPFNVAVVAIDAEAVNRWARKQGITVERPAEDSRVHGLIQQEIAARSAGFKEYERPRHFILTPEDFTVDNELLTPTLKVKRARVMARYGNALEALYDQRANPS